MFRQTRYITYDSDQYGFQGSIGKVTEVKENWVVDLRGDVSWATSSGDGFEDTQGVEIDGIDIDSLEYGVSAGVLHAWTENWTNYSRLGAHWTNIENTVVLMV